MRTVYVTQKGASLRRQGGIFQVTAKGSPLAEISPHDLGQIVLMGNIIVSPSALDLITERGVDLVYLSTHGRYRGRFVHQLSGHVALRLAQYRALADPLRARALAGQIVETKIQNGRNFLLKFARRYGGCPEIEDAVRAMGAARARVPFARDLDQLRGCEGIAAASYFRGFRGLIRSEGFHFHGRNRRPPMDPVNALLSLGYTLLFNAIEAALAIVGLDPYLGALHAVSAGRPSLACDLIEEFRTPVVDAAVVAAINRRVLTPGDFEEVGPGEPVLIRREAVGVFARVIERKLQTPAHYPPVDKALPYRQILEQQARALARTFMDTSLPYVPYQVR